MTANATDSDWALVVGVSRYPDRDFGDLSGPELDAQGFYDWVTSPTGGGITKKSHVKLILSSQFKPFKSPVSAKPTVESIQRFFEELGEEAKKNEAHDLGRKVGRRLYIYFGGHGFAPTEDETALLTANATADFLHHIPGKAWANLFYRGLYFDEILLFMDCCRVTLLKTPPNEPRLKVPPNPEARDKGKRLFAFACGPGRTARERVMKDGKSRGVFTTALLEGLRGGASNPFTKSIAASDLRGYLLNNMKNYLAPEDLTNKNIPTEPVIEPPAGEDKDFEIVKASPIEYPVKIVLPELERGKTVNVRWGKLPFEIVKTTQATPPEWNLTAPVGQYIVEIVNGPSMKPLTVNAVRGGDDVRFD